MGQISESSQRSILIAGSLLGAFQGLIWTVLSILSILYYSNAVHPFSNSSMIANLLYEIFLSDNIQTDLIVNGSTFNKFMYVYAVLSVFWFFISSYTWIKSCHRKIISTKFIYVYIWIWSAITLISSVIDLVLMILVAKDFDVTNGVEWSINGITSDDIDATYWIVISLAVRGYLFWVINVILAIITIKIGLDLQNNENSSQSNQQYINAYESRSVLDFERPNDQRTSNNPYAFVNNSYQQDEVDTATMQHKVDEYFNFNEYETNLYSIPYKEEQRNQYYSNLNHFRANNENKSPDVYYSNSSNAYFEPNKSALHTINNNKVATIGRKQGKRTPPYQVPPPVAPNAENAPYIPPPDYSPPASPRNERRIKPALKTTSNYRY